MACDMKPDFLVIGAAKSGTTSLCDLLARHPAIFMTDPKEPGFFSFDRNYAKGMDWYARFFENAAPGQMKGEGSANYTMLPGFPQTAGRIGRHLPQARLVYIVRHPVDRMVSTWKMLVRRRPGTAGFADSVRDESLRQYFVDRSRYWYQVQAYRQHFADDRILVLFFEDFIESPVKILRRVFEFLEVNPDFVPDSPGRRRNASRSYRQDRPWLAPLRDLGLTRRLRTAMPPAMRARFRRLLTVGYSDQAVCDRNTLAWLAEQLREDTTTFLSFYGRESGFWSLDVEETARFFSQS